MILKKGNFMEMKKYEAVQVELMLLYANDIVTFSAPEFDEWKDNDVGGDDAFGDC